MDLTPGPEIYRACAEASWNAPGTQRLFRNEQRDSYIRLMVLRPDFRALVDAAYRAGREDAAKAIDDARAYPYIDVEKAKALARGQQLQPEPWEVRAAATGGGPCGTCGKPFYTHVCLSCSPDYQTPGPGCCNCRNTGMDQTPCKPA